MTGTADVAAFEQVLEHLQQTRGFDFTAYKRTTVMRRMTRRMQMVDVASFDEYLDYLQVHQEEFAALFNAILINVTSFFRDEEVWALLKDRVLPELLDAAPRDRPVRIWSAGCASGQEPYSLAMLLAEQLGMDAFRERVKIYATDADDEALTQARTGAYAPRQVGEVPPALLEKYFDHAGSQCVVNRELRRSVIFGRHDLLLDAPISRVDLLLCRNTLMYFQAEAQARILARFYFALNPGGLVMLGRAEMLFSHSAMFAPLDLKRRLFRALPKPRHKERLLIMANAGREPTLDVPAPHRLQDIAFESDAAAQIVVDASGTLVAASASARLQFALVEEDIGRPLQDLEISYRPAELRASIALAVKEQREVVLKDVDWSLAGTARMLRIRAVPLIDDHAVAGVRILFQDVTEITTLQNALVQAKQELDTAYEELQSTNEELETTNEELQSAVEELETTNEELQSTNEELETMNEELQSTNEELQTMNDELRSRGFELNSAKSFLESIFTSLRSAVVVLDRMYRVTVWNDRAADLWGVRQDEAVGTFLPSLDIGLPVEELRAPIHDVLAARRPSVEITTPATSRKGRAIECRVSIAPLTSADRTVDGVILLIEVLTGPHAMKTYETLVVRTNAARGRLSRLQEQARLASVPPSVVRKSLEELSTALEELSVANEHLQNQITELTALRRNETALAERFAEFVDVLPVACVWTDDKGTIDEANAAAAELLNVAAVRLPGKPISLFVSDRPTFFAALAALRTGPSERMDIEVSLRPRERRERRVRAVARRLQHDGRLCWTLETIEQPAALPEGDGIRQTA